MYNRYTLKGELQPDEADVGFILSDHAKDFPQAAKELRQWVEEGKLTVDRETVVDTKFEGIPQTWQKLFTGENQGTLVTKLV